MSTPAMPTPDSQGSSAASPQGGGAGPQGSSSTSAPANDLQMLLARWYQTAKQMASSDPRLASGMNKVSEGIQEAQTALVTPQQPTSLGQQPSY